MIPYLLISYLPHISQKKERHKKKQNRTKQKTHWMVTTTFVSQLNVWYYENISWCLNPAITCCTNFKCWSRRFIHIPFESEPGFASSRQLLWKIDSELRNRSLEKRSLKKKKTEEKNQGKNSYPDAEMMKEAIGNQLVRIVEDVRAKQFT